jgi:hypothetical protein
MTGEKRKEDGKEGAYGERSGLREIHGFVEEIEKNVHDILSLGFGDGLTERE